MGQTIGLATTALAAQPLIERGIRQIDLFFKKMSFTFTWLETEKNVRNSHFNDIFLRSGQM